MRGDSLPGGAEMDFEARGLPARPKQPQSQAPYQAPESEESRSSEPGPESENRQQDRPVQGGKQEDVSSSSVTVGDS